MISINKINSFDLSYTKFVLSFFPDIMIASDGEFLLDISLGNKFNITKNDKVYCISICKKNQLFYAITKLIANNSSSSFSIDFNSEFENIIFMYDCSRAAVLNMDTIKKLIIQLAKLGYTGLELYTEDTYEITEEPYFGHLRGRLTKNELKEIDEYASNVGIELIPCIQTLAHLESLFLWPHFEDVYDLHDCLLIDEPKTYELIDNMFKTCAECFTSRTINIGYDESYFAGRGKYLDNHGLKNKTDLLFDHLIKVTNIASKYGFKCVVYSDMFFNNKECLNRSDIPHNIEFNYWDYYRTLESEYDAKYEQHFKLVKEVNFTAGAWKWLGPTPFNKFGIARLIPGVASAKKHHVKTITLSAWGDNGNECALYAAAPQMLAFSDLCYEEKLSNKRLNELCKVVFNVSYDDLLSLDIANGHKNSNYDVLTNPAKYILYNDPLCGIMDYHIDSSYNDYFKSCVTKLKKVKKRSGEYEYLFNTQIALCDYLSVKANMGNDLYKLYNDHNLDGLKDYVKVVDMSIKKLKVLMDAFRISWFKENKSFGLDVIQNRLGGQLARLSEVKHRISLFVNGTINKIEELEQPKLPCNYRFEKDLVYKHNYRLISSTYYPVS